MTGLLNPNVFGAAQASNARDAVLALLQRGQLFRYPDGDAPSTTARFERAAAAWLGATYAVAVASGTAGLRVALRAAGVQPGDSVLVPAFTFIATAAAPVAIGAVPEPIDIAPDLGIDLDDLHARLHPRVRCAIAVHLQGHAVDTSVVVHELARRNIPLVEDACQGFGAQCRGVAAGTTGAAGVFSFQQSKQLSAGEGGLVVSSDPALAMRCARLADLGAIRAEDGTPSWDDEDAVLAENMRMTELQSVLLQRQLEDLNCTLTAQHQARDAVIASLDSDTLLRVVRSADPQGDAASHLLIRVDNRSQGDAVIAHARANGVLVRRIWDRVYYGHSVFARAGLTPGQLGVPPAPRAEALADTLLSVPTPAGLDEHGANSVARVISKTLRPAGACT